MKPLRDYRIAHVGLKEGVHSFDFEVGNDFFEQFEDSLIQGCRAKVRVSFEKKTSFFLIQFFIDGWVDVECDRCLEPFAKEIFGDFQMIVKYADDPDKMEEDDEVMYIRREDDFIDLSQLLYEFIHICLPMQVTHPKNADGTEGCNPEILKYLTREDHPEQSESDQRWAALNKIKFDKN